MNENLVRARDNFIEGIGHLSTTVGLSRVTGQLYATLFFSNSPLCLDDIVERLKISKGSASVNIRTLERWGLVRKVWVKGSRKDFYEAEVNFEKIINGELAVQVRRKLGRTLDTLTETENLIKEIPEDLNQEDKKTVEFYQKRLRKMKEIYKLAEGFLESILS